MNKQEAAFEKLSRLKVGALFMEMGTGKTKVALDLICSKMHKVDYVLWICPFSIKNEIEAERLKWQPSLKMDIVGCESIGSSGNIYLELLYKVKNSNAFIVVDESLKIKNLTAKRTIRILQLGKYAKYKLILNGTPLSKNVLDIYPQMNFLSPKILNMTYIEFKNKYCEYYVCGRLKNKVKKQYNVPHLISLISPYIFDSSLELEALKNYHEINYSVEDVEQYQLVKSRHLCFDSDIDFFSLATSLQHFYCIEKNKIDKVEELANKLDGQVIVFVKYLESIPPGASRLVGNKTIEERKKILDDFRNGNFKTLYITYGCGSFGLNLQCAHNVIFADHTFDYAERLQAEARVYRMGQSYNVDYYNFNCNCGLDRLIRGCLKKKTNLLQEVKCEIEKKGAKEWLKTI